MPIRMAFMCAAALFCIPNEIAIADGPAATAPKSPRVTIYDPDPEHLLNRLHRALAVRTIDGVDYGTDNAVPYLGDPPEHAPLLAVLDEFSRIQTPDRPPGELPRALLQQEAWATFDRTVYQAQPELRAQRARLAKVIAMLAMSDSYIARLPDNYADAAKSGVFPRDFDPANPDETFLPRDLFDVQGPWVEISDDQHRTVAPTHMESLGGRSAFRIFIRCPGDRQDTLAYLQQLNLHTTPWALEPATIATILGDGRKVRWNPLRLDPKTPHFPAGTMFALVRQMILINDKQELRASRITQSVQFRVFRSVEEGVGHNDREVAAKAQAFFELNMRRADLLAGKAGGLHAVAKDDVEYHLFPLGGHNDEPRASRLRGSVVMSTCTACHSANGIFSIRTYGRGTNPQLSPAPNQGQSVNQSLSRKRERFDWGMLRGLMETENSQGE